MRHTKSERSQYVFSVAITSLGQAVDGMQQGASRIVRPGQPQQILLTHRKGNSPQILRHQVTGVIIDGNAGRLVPLVDSVGGDDRRGVSVLNNRVQNALVACADPCAHQGGEKTDHEGCEQRPSGRGSVVGHLVGGHTGSLLDLRQARPSIFDPSGAAI
jgi:hypothetical protein